ncbi:hypothetical protein [Cohnella herbarum]|uniref:Uncharacterized protein n=1 Tax=Cohnella herbarum TaxID=2728023 RepID=A0A7Z2VF74_9BACL|nr:hypothetical protein [Cohnella herbarum]QJD82091.1 hypothetical protein HH215_02125 [Cohnella herbarum]
MKTLSMVFSGEVNGFADIGSYFSKDYRQVTGVPNILERMTRRDKTQDIEVNNIKLLNTHKGLDEHEDKVIEFYYLPKSKFIVKMRIE